MEKPSKRAVNFSSENDVDRLSDLPDAILCHILSFLDTKYAVGTCVLSTRWKNLCLALPNIVFDSSLIGIKWNPVFELDFTRFALRQIVSQNVPSIKEFRLHCDFNFQNPVIQNLFCVAIWRNIERLDISTRPRLFAGTIIPPEVFASRSLVTLKLDAKFELDVPQLVRLPNLKVFHFQCVKLADNDSMRRLFKGCKLLQHLLIIGCKTFDHVDVVDLSIPSLTHLTFIRPYKFPKIVIDTPNLEVLEYCSVTDDFQVVNELKSLHTAKIQFISLKDHKNVYQLINMMHRVKTLSLSCNASKVLQLSCYSLGVFKDLTCLEFWFPGLQVLSRILENTPQLQKLVIFCYPVAETEDVCSHPKSVPMCLVKHLKNIEFGLFGARDCEFEIVKYLLQNGKVLEMIKFKRLAKLGTQDLLATFNRISMFPKSSKDCKIVFGSMDS